MAAAGRAGWRSSEMPMDDPALVKALRAGDPQAPRLLIEQYQGVVFGLCYRMMNHQQDAEDVAQETFVRALRAMAGFDAARPIRPWLLEIAANRCRTALARRSPNRPKSWRTTEPDWPIPMTWRASSNVPWRLCARSIDWSLCCFMSRICRTKRSPGSSPGPLGRSKHGSIGLAPSWRNT
jgi:Sigma-70 region 2